MEDTLPIDLRSNLKDSPTNSLDRVWRFVQSDVTGRECGVEVHLNMINVLGSVLLRSHSNKEGPLMTIVRMNSRPQLVQVTNVDRLVVDNCSIVLRKVMLNLKRSQLILCGEHTGEKLAQQEVWL